MRLIVLQVLFAIVVPIYIISLIIEKKRERKKESRLIWEEETKNSGCIEERKGEEKNE